jgi:3-hydroxyisobutyrate dehydrogenase-like beta-hydroxyacid dehydrogenase
MMTSAIKHVGVVGVGRMGKPIVGHLASKGFTVFAYDRDPHTREAVGDAGVNWAESLAFLGESCDAILICVGYDREVRDLLSPNGLLKYLRGGTVIAILSTVHPRTVQELAHIASPLGVFLVDATVCRGGRAADEGTLLSFVAGDTSVVERLRPVLSCFSTDIVPTGAVGSAQVAKAANNMVMWACLIANHEALALAKRSGIDVELLREALLKTGAENYVLRHWGTNTMAWAEDDLEIVQSMAQNAGLGLPQAGLNREVCRTLKPKRFELDKYGV